MAEIGVIVDDRVEDVGARAALQGEAKRLGISFRGSPLADRRPPARTPRPHSTAAPAPVQATTIRDSRRHALTGYARPGGR